MNSIIDKFGEDITIYANDMNSFKVQVNIATTNIFFSWIFGFGGKVMIKSPDSVKNEYFDMLKKAKNQAET